jgi:hypothetical protein
MERFWKLSALFGALILLGNSALAEEQLTEHGIPEALINRLPSAYQEKARELVTVPDIMRDSIIDFYAASQDDEWRGLAFRSIAEKPEGVEFLRAQLDKEPSGLVRAQLILALEKYFADHPQDQAVLEKYVSSAPDATAALTALDMLRRIKLSDLGQLLEKRLKTAQRGDEDVIKKLRDEQLQHYMWYGDVHLPDFAYGPPAVFQVMPTGQSVRVLAFGDFGYGSGEAQVKAAAAMRAYHQEHPFAFGITLGDNIYGRGPFSFADRIGLSSPDDPRWQTLFEQLYTPMGIKFYPSIGNADYIDPNGLAAELAYTKKSQSWVFPAPYYTYTAGPVQFFAIDNIRLSDDELHWLDGELGKSKAHWKVVYGHYPIYTYTYNSEAPVDNEDLIGRLVPVLKKNSVDVWINGHNHELQELPADGGLHFFVSGGGGATTSGIAPTYKGSSFRAGQYGFAVLEADEQHFDVKFVNQDGKELHRSQITK